MPESLETADRADALEEHYPPLTRHEALVEANRCLFCYDAPCTHACPTHIDIPRFIKKIATENTFGSAQTIFESNLLGATCARVCPVQELCEGACVLGAEHKPIMIGRLQRYAMDYGYAHGGPVFPRAASTGKKVAVIGSGPAGLSCAGELARRGHSVTVFERRALPNGLSTYGIISLREPVPIALAEAEMIRELGVAFRFGVDGGSDISLAQLLGEFDAVFYGAGMGATQKLFIPGEELIEDGLRYIEQSKLEPGGPKVGRNVVVIGAGNTAIDCATIARRRGAGRVTIVYRRTDREMTAYPHEYEFIKREGVGFRFLSQPVRVLSENGRVTGLECVCMELGAPDASGRPAPRPAPGSEFQIAADQIVKAIGQDRSGSLLSPELEVSGGYICVSHEFETSIRGLFAGGDCVRARGSASTVMAVQDGKLAAAAIHNRLTRTERGEKVA